MMPILRFLLCTALLVSYSAPSFAKGPASISVGLGKLSGDTTYRIGGRVDTPDGYYWIQPDPTSELKFPLDVNMVMLKGEISFSKRLSLNINLSKNITDDAGNMKDSDWGLLYMESRIEYPYNPLQWAPITLDVYSESDADLDGMMADINLNFILFKKNSMSFFAGAGYIYQKFDYDVKNARQWYPSTSFYYDEIEGKVLTYKVEYAIPYFKGGIQYVNGRFTAEASLGYSPKTEAEDKDVHLARDPIIVSEGDCDGTALMFGLKGGYAFSEQLSLTLQIDRLSIETDGDMSSLEDGSMTWIDEELESHQMLYSLSAQYSF